MELVKAKIAQVVPSGPEFDVLFNPTEYRISESNQFAEVAMPGLGAPLLQFGHGNTRTLSMTLFYDSYDPQPHGERKNSKDKDIRTEIAKLTKLLEINGHLHAPPICQFSWAAFVFVGVLQQADVKLTLFLPGGVPVRGTVDATFKQYYDGQKERSLLQSAHFYKEHVVRAGDTLTGIAAELYGDPTKWRPIAEENNIDDPLVLTPGRLLIIPAVE